MRSMVYSMLAIVLVLSMASFVFAREGPTKQGTAVTHQAIAVAPAMVSVMSVPPMTVGFDVIQNLSTAYPRLASDKQYAADTSVSLRLSPTVNWRSINANQTVSGQSAPDIVLRA